MVKKTITLIFLLLFLVFLLIPTNTSAAKKVYVHITGPDVIGVGERNDYTITILGGPAEEDGEWNYTAYLIGTNLTGASPLFTSPATESSNNNAFVVEVTSPSIEQNIKLFVNGTSTKNDQTMWKEETYEIKVVEPIIISATIQNAGELDIQNADVKFYVDSKYVGFETIDFLMANSSKDITHKWIVKSLSLGTHIVKITVDLNGDGVIGEGDVVITQSFYKSGEKADYTWTIYIAIITAIMFTSLIVVGRKSQFKFKKRKK